jgi:glycosyltransferase involved in cell wall biosynthesis
MVSVIIPVYNRERYIAEALNSVLQQTEQPLEIIVVDDGSTDNTQQVVRTFLSDPRITLICQEHSGKPSIARNRGIKNARGKYLCFLDSDDILLPKSIATRLQILEHHKDVGVVCSDWLDFKGGLDSSSAMPSYIARSGFLNRVASEHGERQLHDAVVLGPGFIYEIFYTNIVKTSTVIIRRELFDKAGGFDEALTIGEDCDLWLRLGTMTRFCYCLSPQCYARSHRLNITRDMLKNYREDARVIEKFLASHEFIKDSWKKRFYAKVADFYFDGAWHLYTRNRFDEARCRFRKAFRYQPFRFRHLKSMVVIHLPHEIIVMLRRLRKSQSSGETADA